LFALLPPNIPISATADCLFAAAVALAGMHGIVLSFDNDNQLEQSTRFLQKVHPLNYTAAIKKSQVWAMKLSITSTAIMLAD
jgi:hypothetical protein